MFFLCTFAFILQNREELTNFPALQLDYYRIDVLGQRNSMKSSVSFAAMAARRVKPGGLRVYKFSRGNEEPALEHFSSEQAHR